MSGRFSVGGSEKNEIRNAAEAPVQYVLMKSNSADRAAWQLNYCLSECIT